jgi:acyl-coenzyme A thioesterase PaaI-like protein
MRFVMNHWPAIARSGGRITYIAPGLTEVHIKLSLNWRTFNAVGTIFGGSMYAACDPFFMLILMRQLGPDYIVWDKAATIHFKKPGRGTLQACFRIEPEEVEAIQKALETERSIDRVYAVDLVNESGEPAATVEKVLYIRKGDRRAQAQHPIARFFNNLMQRA